jgi:hypothetical protein
MLSVSWILSLFTFTALAQGLGPSSTGANDPCELITETETTQTLSNGTHIVFKSYSRFYRDSLARTRTEIFPDQSPQVGAPQEPIEIVIIDPVEGAHYSLNPRNHTGMRYKIELPTLVPSESLPTSVVDAAPAPPPDSPQLITQGTTEDLGMQMIEGVLARGTRITTTFPVNAVGNDQPIVTLSEQWYSEELKMNVLTKESDPRTGETTERVTVDTSEPDPTLFRPPAD